MGVVRYNKPISLSAYSITEASYIIDSYIEESFNDLQIKCLLADKRSLNESGVRYFTEDNEVGKQKLGEKIKQIAANIWNTIAGIFDKIGEFFSRIGTNIMIKKASVFLKKEIENAANSDFANVVRYQVKKMYNLTELEKLVDKNTSKIDSTFAKKDIGDIKDYCAITDSDDIENMITKQYVLDNGFGGFKKMNSEASKMFSKVRSAFRKSTDNFDVNIPDLKTALKYLSTISSAYSQMIIHNSKEVASLVKYYYKEYVKDPENAKFVDHFTGNDREIKKNQKEIDKKLADFNKKFRGE
jgi:hypothetical protein